MDCTEITVRSPNDSSNLWIIIAIIATIVFIIIIIGIIIFLICGQSMSSTLNVYYHVFNVYLFQYRKGSQTES